MNNKDKITEVHGEKLKCIVNDSGDYIGNKYFADKLKRLGINPEFIDEQTLLRSIGFSEKDGKWYGWSHRALYGFKIGSKVEKGDCAYRPVDNEDFLDDMVRFWGDEGSRLNVEGVHTTQEIMYSEPINVGEPEQKDVGSGVFEEGVYVSWVYSNNIPNEKLRNEVSGVFTSYPDEYGRGEWIAETLEDAKQMAIDFAHGVG